MSGPFKMKGSSALGYGNQHSEGGMPMYDSPAQKALVGDQKNLPEDLQAKISAAPYASPAKRTTGDVLTKNIVNTNQKGDEEIRAKKASKAKSKKVGPVESPKAIKKKAEKVFTERDKIKATAKKGDSFETYMGEGPASKAAEKKYDEAKDYVKK